MPQFCQSCGMPLSKDPHQGGSNADGSKSTEYCSYCYQNGQFHMPQIDTPQKMQAMCIQQMKKSGTPGWWAWILTRGIPRLKRWQT